MSDDYVNNRVNGQSYTQVKASYLLGGVLFEVVHPLDKTPEAAEAAEYLWEEGNYSCDCNRAGLAGLPQMSCGETSQLVALVFS